MIVIEITFQVSRKTFGSQNLRSFFGKESLYQDVQQRKERWKKTSKEKYDSTKFRPSKENIIFAAAAEKNINFQVLHNHSLFNQGQIYTLQIPFMIKMCKVTGDFSKVSLLLIV